MQTRRSKGFKAPFVIVIAVVSLLIGLGSGYALFHSNVNNNDSTINEALMQEALTIIEDRWYDSTDSKTPITQRMISGMIAGLDDPHTMYMSASEMSDFTNTVNGDYEGIGISFLLVNEGAFVTKVYKDTPAEKASLRTGDIIIKADGTSLKGLTIEEIKDKIAGKADTSVEITYIRDSKSYVKTLKRAAFDTDVIYSVKKVNNKTFGYLQIATFGTNTSVQVEEALKVFKNAGAKVIVIDLRDNGGGYLNAAYAILNFLNKEGQTLFMMEDKNGKKETYTDESDHPYTFDQGYVMINGSTASASELLAGSLKETLGYTLVGTTSYGKGTAQLNATLSDSSVIKYTYAKWYTPNGKNIHLKGLAPDIEVKRFDFSSVDISGFKTTYKYNQVNSHIKTMQLMLKQSGYKVDRTDGYFSKKTRLALMNFEKKNKLSVNGVYDEKDFRRLLAEFSVYYEKLENDTQYKRVVKELS